MTSGIKRREDALDWSNLPDELCLKIFSFLPWHDIEKAAEVCPHWHRVSQDSTLWPSYFRLLRGILQNGDPTLYLEMPKSLMNQFRIFPNHIAYLGPTGCTLMPIDDGDEKVVELPFKVEKLRWHPDGLVAVGRAEVALIDPAKAAVIKRFDGDTILFFTNRIMIEEMAEGILVQKLSGESLLSIPKAEGHFVEARCAKETLALILRKGDHQILTIYHLVDGEKLFEQQAAEFTGLDVTDEGDVLFEENNGFCAVYSFKQHKVFVHHAFFDDNEDWTAQYSKDHFLCFTPDNKVRVCSFETGAIVSIFQSSLEIICAALWEDRLILYTSDHIFSLWNIKSQELLFSMLIDIEVTEGDCARLPNISHNIIALKKKGAIVLVDVIAGKIVREFESSRERSDLFLNEDTLHEITSEKNSLVIRSRKFF